MENEEVVVLDEGVEIVELAATMACCRPSSPSPATTTEVDQ